MKGTIRLIIAQTLKELKQRIQCFSRERGWKPRKKEFSIFRVKLKVDAKPDKCGLSFYSLDPLELSCGALKLWRRQLFLAGTGGSPTSFQVELLSESELGSSEQGCWSGRAQTRLKLTGVRRATSPCLAHLPYLGKLPDDRASASPCNNNEQPHYRKVDIKEQHTQVAIPTPK